MDLIIACHGQIHICGHRGHSVDGHENTRPALRRAADHGASFCEIDLRRSRDGVFLVFHDDLLEGASSGIGLIGRQDFSTLAPIRTKARDGRPIEGQPIERFEDILVNARDLGLGLIVEIKDPIRDPEVIWPVWDAIDAAGMKRRVLISSFDHLLLRNIGQLWDGVRTYGISYHRLVAPADLARQAGFSVLNIDYPHFTAEAARALHDADIAVGHYLPRPGYFAQRQAFGVDYYSDLRAYLADGLIDMLTCDDVAWAMDFAQSCGLTPVPLPVEREPNHHG